MAKLSYKIPNTLDKNYLDTEITFKFKNGLTARPLAIKVILFYLASGMGLFYTILNSFMAAAPILFKALYVIIWVALTVILAKYTPTKQMQVQMITSLLNYIPSGARNVIVRANKKATAFWGIVGIQSVSSDGLVEYADGTFAYFYRVVGSASILLFEEDRDLIIERVDSFYRKIGTDVELITLTNKESQKVYNQVYYLNQRYEYLQVRDPDLLACMEEQFDVLKNHVGGSFRSIHQYLILKADNYEALLVARNILRNEVENSTRIFKQCVTLDEEDIYDVLQSIYKAEV